jgi:type II secretory pathway pseudopilin PulG
MRAVMPVVSPSFVRGRRASSAQRGVSLIIAMAMLVVIGLVSVAVMRNASSSDVVSVNTRAQAQANQYAQVAEKFCESQIPTTTKRVGYQTGGTAPYWSTFANWYPAAASGKAHTLSAAELSNTDSTIVTPVDAAKPQCMFEDLTIPGNTGHAFIVTARGFSVDYKPDGKGNTATGSVVWLQAVVTTN